MPFSSSQLPVYAQGVASVRALRAAARLADLEREPGPGARVALGVFGTCDARGGSVVRATDHEYIAEVFDRAAVWHVDVEDQV
jgi:hypothetical protein